MSSKLACSEPTRYVEALTANNGVITHDLEVLANEDVTAAGGGDEDLTKRSSLLHGGNLKALDGSLESVDRVNLSDKDTGTHAVKSLGAALADITITSDNADLSGNHDIGGTLDTVDERLAAAVQVVELGLGDGVVDVDGGDEELALLEHPVEVVDTSGGLLGETVAALELIRVLGVDEGSQITTVIEDEVELLAIAKGLELLIQAPVVLFLGLTLPGEAVAVRIVIWLGERRLTQGHRQRQWQRQHGPGWRRCCSWSR